jgi:hypothetical protein
MSTCDVCGNSYDHSFQVQKNGQSYTFDCFECAIHKLAPACKHCGCRIVGHGIDAEGEYYCCAHCARKEGISEARDHV